MMFGLRTNRESLRDLIVATEAHSGKLYHITTASIHHSKAIPEIPLEADAYYIFDRGNNDLDILDYCCPVKKDKIIYSLQI